MTLIDKLRSGEAGAIKGILLLAGAIFVFTVQDVILKFMSSDYAMLEIIVIQSSFTVPIVLAIAHFNGGLAQLKTKSLGLQLVRGLLMFLSYMCFLLAIAALPYNMVITLYFSGPLFITALSVPLLKEWVGWRRWVAVLVGFGGVLIVIRPEEGGFDFAAILAVVSAFLYAVGIILTRKMDDSASSMATYTIAVYLLSAIILSPFFARLDFVSTHPSLVFLSKVWTMPPWQDMLLILALALCWGIGMVLLSAAYTGTAVAILAPFEYFSVFFGLLFGYIFWREIPTAIMLVGVALIVGSGLFIIYRENQN